MKKMVQRFLCAGMALAMALALAACGGEGGGGSGGVTEAGTWELTELEMRTIEQGKLATANHSTITLFSDNTFVVTAVMDTLYSSDGGESYSPSYYGNAMAYGTYETIDTNEELGESTIRIKEITRVVAGDYDTAVSGTDADKEVMANSAAVGMEIILGADHKMSEIIGWRCFYGINSPAAPG